MAIIDTRLTGINSLLGTTSTSTGALALSDTSASSPDGDVFIPFLDNDTISFVDRSIKKFILLVKEQKLGIPLPDLNEIRDHVFNYIVFQNLTPFEAGKMDVGLPVLICLFMAHEKDFRVYRSALHAVAAYEERNIRTKDPLELELEIKAVLNIQGRQKTTMILGAGRDYETIARAIGEGDFVVVVDSDTAVIKHLEAYRRRLGRKKDRLILETSSYSDPGFMRKYYGKIDRAYGFYLTDRSVAATVYNVLRPGGVFISQDTLPFHSDFTENLPPATSQQLHLVSQYRGLAPVYQSAWAPFCPAHNIIEIIRKNHPPVGSGRYFVTVPDDVRAELQSLIIGGINNGLVARRVPLNMHAEEVSF